MQKTPYVFPVIGCRKLEQLQANTEALDIALSPEQIKYLENVLPFDLGFPHAMVVSIWLRARHIRRDTHANKGDGSEYIRMVHSAGNFDKWPRAQAIRPTSSRT